MSTPRYVPPLRTPPGPKHAIVYLFSLMSDLFEVMQADRKKYGDPMWCPLPGQNPAVLTAQPDVVKTLFAAPSETFGASNVEIGSMLLGKSSLFVVSGERHRTLRKLLAPPFHGQRMRLFGEVIRTITCEHLDRLLPSQTFVAQDLFRQITLTLMMRIVFGVHQTQKLDFLQQQLLQITQVVGPALILLPRWELGGLSPWGRFVRARRSVAKLVFEELSARRSAPKKSDDQHVDILDGLLAARYEDGQAISDEDLLDQLFTLLAAGFVTTSTALTWALYFLHREPAVLARLRDELAGVTRTTPVENWVNHPYLDAVCNETLRIRPLLGILLRQLARPLSVCGYDLTPGTQVGIHVYWAHFDPAVFPDPLAFRPERFLGRSYSPFEFFPYGGGIRRCLGSALASYELKIALATLVTQADFRLLTNPDQPIYVKQGTNILEPKLPIEFSLKARR